MTAEAIAKALGVRKVGAAWVARCPAHEDREPSLSIAHGDNGKVLVRCHAGCEQHRVIAAMQIGNRAHVRNSGVTPMHDRATVVAQAAMELLVATMHGELQPREFYQQLVQLLRDEFADERCQAAADREPPDA